MSERELEAQMQELGRLVKQAKKEADALAAWKHAVTEACRQLGLGWNENDPMQAVHALLASSAPEARQRIELGRIEFHSPKKEALIDRFYAVTDDLKASGSIVDIWLMDIATVLKEHGYSMEIYKDKT